MDKIKQCYNKHIKPYIEQDLDIGDDVDIITFDLVKDSMIKLGNISDILSLAFMEENGLEEYKKAYNECRDLVIVIYEISLALSYQKQHLIEVTSDKLAASLSILDTTYYISDGDLIEKIKQLTKFTNKNALQSIVIRTISGDKYNMDLNIIKEQIFNMYLSYSRLLQKIDKKVQSTEDNLLELIIFCTSLGVLFNIENNDLCQ